MLMQCLLSVVFVFVTQGVDDILGTPDGMARKEKKRMVGVCGISRRALFKRKAKQAEVCLCLNLGEWMDGFFGFGRRKEAGSVGVCTKSD